MIKSFICSTFVSATSGLTKQKTKLGHRGFPAHQALLVAPVICLSCWQTAWLRGYIGRLGFCCSVVCVQRVNTFSWLSVGFLLCFRCVCVCVFRWGWWICDLKPVYVRNQRAFLGFSSYFCCPKGLPLLLRCWSKASVGLFILIEIKGEAAESSSLSPPSTEHKGLI